MNFKKILLFIVILLLSKSSFSNQLPVLFGIKLASPLSNYTNIIDSRNGGQYVFKPKKPDPYIDYYHFDAHKFSEKIYAITAIKRNIAAIYDNAIKSLKNIRPMPRLEWGDSSCWLYSIKTSNKQKSLSIIEFLKSKNIEAKLFWKALSTQIPYKGFLNELQGNSVELSGSIVSIPCSTSLKNSEQQRVIEALIEWDSLEKI